MFPTPRTLVSRDAREFFSGAGGGGGGREGGGGTKTKNESEADRRSLCEIKVCKKILSFVTVGPRLDY